MNRMQQAAVGAGVVLVAALGLFPHKNFANYTANYYGRAPVWKFTAPMLEGRTANSWAKVEKLAKLRGDSSEKIEELKKKYAAHVSLVRLRVDYQQVLVEWVAVAILTLAVTVVIGVVSTKTHET